MDSEDSKPVTKFSRNVSAREVGEYEFCSVAWYLDITGNGKQSMTSEDNLGSRVIVDRRNYRNSKMSDNAVKGLVAVVLVLTAFLVALVI
ncbi:MAG: hypothetical protein M1454_02515 [Candidatus Thermoplasmatota archaeon]|nr:hypothetical protein [Candidatus Thermoplasmatota archaeon]MCL5730764.1 hypothetical protein [Candidatus Thermoplasmatota archaeon]